MCGAIVRLTIVSETQKVYEYQTRTRKTKPVGTQHGQPSNPLVKSVITRNTPVENPPKKLKRKKKSTNVASTKVHNLPGKAKKTTLKPKTPKKNVTGKCCECNTIWESKEDEIFRKLNGQKKTTWIGCDKSQCRYWVHALCAGLVLIPGKPIKEHSFFCKDHKIV